MATAIVTKVGAVLVLATMLGVSMAEEARSSTDPATPEVTYATPLAPRPIPGDEWAPTQTHPGRPY